MEFAFLNLKAEKTIDWGEASIPDGVDLHKVYIGPDPSGLGGFQVAVGSASAAPSRQLLRDLHAARKRKTEIQLIVAVVNDGVAHVLGPFP